MTVENYLLFIALQCLPNNICTFLELWINIKPIL